MRNLTKPKGSNNDPGLQHLKDAVVNIWDDLNQEKDKLEVATAKNEAIIASIGDGIVVTDKEGKVILLNRAATELLGVSEEKVLQKNWFEAVQMEDEAGNLIPLEKRPTYLAIQSRAAVSDNGYYLAQHGNHRFPAAVMSTPVLMGDEVTGAVLVFRDITKEKQIDKAKTEFVSLASHQLRTPLSTINWYLESVLRHEVANLTAKQQAYLTEAYEASQRMVTLVNTLLDVSKIEIGSLAHDPTPNDVNQILEQSLKDVAHEIAGKQLQVHKHYTASLPPVLVDAKMLAVAFYNLLSNAAKYTPEGKEITLTTKQEGGQVVVMIADTGYGIPKDQQPKIFTKLFRADNAREKEPDGNGLGLYIVKSIIEQSSGTITFTSAENQGTTFTITLPLTHSKPTS